MPNSAENEITSFSGTENQNEWLKLHGLIELDTDDYTIQVIQDWYRPGSESYILHFSVEQKRQDGSVYQVEYIDKACIKPPCGETMREWLKRRAVLEEAGISVPRLYATNPATIIEEFIPFSVREAFEVADQPLQKKIAETLVQTYRELANLGFTPRIMNDLRSRGDDVVLVDFGEDLGGQIGTGTTATIPEGTILNSILGKSIR